jgi:hypothetical protein
MRVISLRLTLTALGIAGLVQPGAAENTPLVPSFVEETASAGIDSVYAGEWEYMVGGGVATFDCNGDGFADMLLAGGTRRKFYRNQQRAALISGRSKRAQLDRGAYRGSTVMAISVLCCCASEKMS